MSGTASAGWPLAATVILLLHLGRTTNRRGEAVLLAVAGMTGFLVDSALTAGGVFTPVRHLFPPPWSPPWMICLWLNFAATLNVSLRWLHGRPRLAALFGALGGPLAYYAGARLGAAAALPERGGLLILALVWALVTPLLAGLAERMERNSCAQI